jgi:pimeloyl-ACP methyl ester carboxylesterase
MNRRIYQNAAALEGDPEALSLDPPASQRLSELQVPILVTAGALDMQHVLTTADYLAEHLPNARKAIIPDAGHMLPMEQPAAFNRVVLKFLLDS